MNTLLNSSERIYYVVKISGKVASTLLESQSAAEHYKLTLSEEQQKQAVIVPVTEDGKQFLVE